VTTGVGEQVMGEGETGVSGQVGGRVGGGKLRLQRSILTL